MSSNKVSSTSLEEGVFSTQYHNSNTDNPYQFCNTCCERETHITGVQKLWRAVIAQAFIDALSNSNKALLKREKARAIKWLLGKSEDFYTTCSLADMDADYVQHKAEILFSNWLQEFERQEAIKKSHKSLTQPSNLETKILPLPVNTCFEDESCNFVDDFFMPFSWQSFPVVHLSF